MSLDWRPVASPVMDSVEFSKHSHPRGRCFGWLLILALAFLPWVTEAAEGNPHLQTALRRYDDLEYEKALRALEKARQWLGSTVEEKVYIELLEGVLDFELQQHARGKDAFLRALALNPDAKLPLRVSPKVVQALEEARNERQALMKSAPVVEPSNEAVESMHGASSTRLNLRMPIAIGGGVAAVGGLLALVHARSLTSTVRSADPSIQSRADLDDTLSKGRTFEKVGWGLMGLGVAASVGSLLFLDAPEPSTRAEVSPTRGGAYVSLSWVLP